MELAMLLDTTAAGEEYRAMLSETTFVVTRTPDEDSTDTERTRLSDTALAGDKLTRTMSAVLAERVLEAEMYAVRLPDTAFPATTDPPEEDREIQLAVFSIKVASPD